MRRTGSESAAAPVSHNAAGPAKLKLPYQTDSDAALLPNLIHQLGSAHEWSGVWIRPESVKNGCFNLERLSRSSRLAQPGISALERL